MIFLKLEAWKVLVYRYDFSNSWCHYSCGQINCRLKLGGWVKVKLIIEIQIRRKLSLSIDLQPLRNYIEKIHINWVFHSLQETNGDQETRRRQLLDFTSLWALALRPTDRGREAKKAKIIPHNEGGWEGLRWYNAWDDTILEIDLRWPYTRFVKVKTRRKPVIIQHFERDRERRG